MLLIWKIMVTRLNYIISLINIMVSGDTTNTKFKINQDRDLITENGTLAIITIAMPQIVIFNEDISDVLCRIVFSPANYIIIDGKIIENKGDFFALNTIKDLYFTYEELLIIEECNKNKINNMNIKILYALNEEFKYEL